jgi:eukaryotic-like serine/threonine-protein kinase
MPETFVLNDRYHIEERLGSGGMAVVYRAQDIRLERTVAIKILRKNYSTDSAFRERFRQEAKAAASLSHPNIVTIHDFGFDEDRLFIVMEHVPGRDLKTILQNAGHLDIPAALNLMIQACAGIGYAHRSGLIHCDVKPQNMLVTQDQKLKVVDFGIARAITSIQPDEKHAVVWGSPLYFSPEQASGLPPSTASDVYSLGVILFEMLAGQVPFNGTSAEELSRSHREALPPTPRRLNPEIPKSLEQILLRALEKQPAARFSNADELGLALATVYQASAYGDIIAEEDLTQATFDPYSLDQEEVIAPTDDDNTSSEQRTSTKPIKASAANQKPLPHSQTIDWMTWFLALLALIVLGGLIPFWIWVYYQINPPF